MDLRHYPVLAVISNCYSEPKGRFPRVTHPCATKPRRTSFDLHVLGMPPAFVLSQNQTLKFMSNKPPQGKTRSSKPASLGAVPAQLRSLWICKLRHVYTHQKPKPSVSALERLGFNRYTRTQRFPVTGAAAHMSLHLNQQCQRAAFFLSQPPFPEHREKRRSENRPCDRSGFI